MLRTSLDLPHDYLPRPRLLERLHPERPVTVVTAPPGSGKSTLVRAWLSTTGWESHWLPLSADWNKYPVFTYFLFIELRKLLPFINDEQLINQPPTMYGRRIVGNLTERADRNFALVLDNYHLIDDPEIHALIEGMVEGVLPQFHLVIISRTVPPLPLARWRMRGILNEITLDDLRFTHDESSVLLKRMVKARISPAQLSTLLERTEGWAAGLRLAGLALADGRDVDAFINGFTGDQQYVRDYLFSEMFERQPKHIQEFLLTTAPLRRICGQLCNHILATEDASKWLEEVLRSNLFLVAQAKEGWFVWYRYQHLFAEMLLARVDDPTEVYRRASQWHEKNRFPGETIRYALLARDYEHAAKLIEYAGRNTMMQGSLRTVLNWIDALPPEFLHVRPRLNLTLALPLTVIGRAEAAAARLADAERGLEGDESPEAVAMLGEVHANRSVVCNLQADFAGAETHARQALAILPADNFMYRGIATMNLGLVALVQADLESAQRYMVDAFHLGQRSEDFNMILMPLNHLGNIQMAAGKLRQAEQTYQEAVKISGQMNHPLVALGYSGLARLALQHGDFERAVQMAESAIQYAEPTLLVNFLLPAQITLMFAYQMQGKTDEAGAAFAAAEQTARDFPRVPGVEFASQRARFHLLTGDLEAARHWAEISGLDVHLPGMAMLGRDIAYLTLAWAYAALREPDKALAILDALLPAAESHGWTGALIEGLVVRALALGAAGDIAGARAALARALTLGEPPGYVLTFTEKGAPLAKLLMSDELPSYRHDILTYMGYTRADNTPTPESLTERERELLRMIADGLSNQAIASHLVLSVSTVKWHLNNLYAKLGIRSRTQAIVRAKELGLLE